MIKNRAEYMTAMDELNKVRNHISVLKTYNKPHQELVNKSRVLMNEVAMYESLTNGCIPQVTNATLGFAVLCLRLSTDTPLEKVAEVINIDIDILRMWENKTYEGIQMKRLFEILWAIYELTEGDRVA